MARTMIMAGMGPLGKLVRIARSLPLTRGRSSWGGRRGPRNRRDLWFRLGRPSNVVRQVRQTVPEQRIIAKPRMDRGQCLDPRPFVSERVETLSTAAQLALPDARCSSPRQRQRQPSNRPEQIKRFTHLELTPDGTSPSKAGSGLWSSRWLLPVSSQTPSPE